MTQPDGHDSITAASAWAQATHNFGEETVAFILDLVPGEVPELEDTSRWQVTVELAAAPLFLEQLLAEQQLSRRAFFLTRVTPGTGLTFVEEARQRVGGRLPQLGGHALTDALIRMAFAGLAIERLPGADRDRLPLRASFNDPTFFRPFADAFLDDADLTRLFPQQDGEVDADGRTIAYGLLTWLPAGGGTTDLRIVAGDIVAQTLARMRFSGQLTESHLPEFVAESLDQLRRAARGEDVPTIVLAGLLGVEVEERFDFGGWGLMPTEGLAIEHWPGLNVPAPKSVLWVTNTQRLIDAVRNDIDEEQVQATFARLGALAQTHSLALLRQIMKLQFSIAAWAARRDLTINLTATSHWTLFPMAGTGAPFLTADQAAKPGVTLDRAAADEIAATTEGLGELVERLDVALTRIIRVCAERRDPADALIDAIVAWENMLGSRTETTFKVCAAMAWLLEPDDANKRRTLFALAKKLYGMRSDLVHGTTGAYDPIVTDELHKHAHDALVMAIGAFQRIHAQADLREVRSSTRSEMLLLGLR